MKTPRKWPWVAQQVWKNILFLHWAVKPSNLSPYISKPFQLDSHNGYAWLTIVLFQATQSRFRHFPSFFSYPSFLQLNVRTYVRYGSEPGVYFFSLHANSPFVVKAASLYSFPAYFSKMTFTNDDNCYHFTSEHNSEIDATFEPRGNPFLTEKSSIAYWLTERYCIWMRKRDKIIKLPISHRQWTLQKVNHRINFLKVAALPAQNFLTNDPLVYYSPYMKAFLHLSETL